MVNKQIRLLALTMILGVAVNAQSIQDGVKALYSGKVLGAKAIFEKQADKPEGAYWLAQADIQDENKAAAQQVVDKALAAKPNNPWALVAKGQLQLMDKKVNEAKQSFEAALTASKGRKGNDPEILNAVGKAITTVFNNVTKIGDINYAVQKLEEAKAGTEKGKNAFLRADILTNLGDAYRKAKPGDGTAAFTAFRDAVDADPSFANAFYRNALIFKSQKNYDLFLQYIDKAIAANPTFVPAYDALYEYKIGTGDFNGAQGVADKIIANSDPSPANDYYKAQTFYFNKQYDQAIASAEGILQKMGEQSRPKVYKLLSYSYMEKNPVDAAKALPLMEKYFSKVDPDDILPQDYNLKAMVYAATPGKENDVMQAYMDGLKSDTTIDGRVKMLQEGAKFFADKGKHELQGDLLSKLIELKPNPTVNDYFEAGYRGYYQGKAYEKAWKVFDGMRTKFPNQNYGYLWTFRNSMVFDSANAKNIMVPDGEKLVAFSQKDTAKDAKANLYLAASTLAPYFVNVAGDKVKGLQYLTLARDNTDDPAAKAQLQQYIDIVGKSSGSSSSSSTGTKSASATDSTGTAPKADSTGTKPKSKK